MCRKILTYPLILCLLILWNCSDSGELSGESTPNEPKVIKSYFGSEDIEEIAMHPALRTEVFVDAADADVKEFIEDELWKYAKLRKRSKYVFNPVDRTFQMNIIQLGEIYNGTYEWSIDSLILNYNGVQEKYGFKIGAVDCYVIQEDKTEEYKRLFPLAGITDVRLNRIWYDHCVIHLGGLDI